MSIMDRFGITKEGFKALYDERQGIDDVFNKNHPTYDKNEDFFTFLESGSRSLIRENKELVVDIINWGL